MEKRGGPLQRLRICVDAISCNKYHWVPSRRSVDPSGSQSRLRPSLPVKITLARYCKRRWTPTHHSPTHMMLANHAVFSNLLSGLSWGASASGLRLLFFVSLFLFLSSFLLQCPSPFPEELEKQPHPPPPKKKPDQYIVRLNLKRSRKYEFLPRYLPPTLFLYA